MRNGAPTIVPIVCRGVNDEYGSWKMICISRRNGRIPDQPNRVISRPSNSIDPPVGDNNFVTTRPVVDFPHPDSPTNPNVSPAHTSNATPSTPFTPPTSP